MVRYGGVRGTINTTTEVYLCAVGFARRRCCVAPPSKLLLIVELLHAPTLMVRMLRNNGRPVLAFLFFRHFTSRC